MKRRRFAILFSVMLLLFTTSLALAQESPDDDVIESGEIIKNDIALFGQGLEIQEGAVVEGDIAIFGGDALIAGTVKGDVALFGGNLTIADTAVFEGDCALLGGDLEDQTELGASCTNVAFGPNFAAPIARFASRFDAPGQYMSHPSAGRQFPGGLAETAGQTLVMALLAFGAAALLPTHLTRMENAVQRKPVSSGIVGLLTAVAVPSLILFLAIATAILIFVCIGILGIPVIFFLAVGLVAGMVLGWIAVGDMVGRWLADKLNLSNRSQRTTAVFGTAVLTFGIGLLGTLPFMIGEGVITVVIGSMGLGAAALTRLGTRPYPLYAGYDVDQRPVNPDPDKVTAVLDTLPVEDADDLKDS